MEDLIYFNMSNNSIQNPFTDDFCSFLESVLDNSTTATVDFSNNFICPDTISSVTLCVLSNYSSILDYSSQDESGC